MDIENQQRLITFLTTQCNQIYTPQAESVRFIAKPGGAAMKFPEMVRLATSLGVAPSGRDLTFFGERKLARLEEMGVPIDRSRGAQLGGFDRT